MQFHVEAELETDGRWIAEILEVPGALAYGVTQQEAVVKAYAIALRSVADDVERSTEAPPETINLVCAIA